MRAPLRLFALLITFGTQEFPLLAHVPHKQYASTRSVPKRVVLTHVYIDLSFMQLSISRTEFRTEAKLGSCKQ